MFERKIDGVMLMAVVGATAALMATAAVVGHAQWPGAAAGASAAPAAARVETTASIEMAGREMAARAPVSSDSCDERPVRRRPREPEGCVDPTAALAPR